MKKIILAISLTLIALPVCAKEAPCTKGYFSISKDEFICTSHKKQPPVTLKLHVYRVPSHATEIEKPKMVHRTRPKKHLTHCQLVPEECSTITAPGTGDTPYPYHTQVKSAR